MSPVATLIIVGIASLVWFGFLRGHLARKGGRESGDGSATDGGGSADCGNDAGSCDGGGDGGGD